MSPQLLRPGNTVASRYKVISYLGEGGMQEVYRVSDNKLRRQVALKVPKNDSAKKRFERSATMSAQVTHPNVAKTLDYFIDNDRQFLVEEYVSGSDLKKRLDDFYLYMDPHLAAHVMHHMAKAIAAVHSVDVFHRDLKPSNVMVSLDNTAQVVKITDFGIAKMAQEEIQGALEKGDESTLASSTAVGALPYMAPEFIENAKAAGLKADVWSLGALGYQLLTGERPYGDGISAVPKILKAEPLEKPPLLRIKAQFRPLSDELWNIICRCMTKDVAKRPNAAEVVGMCSELCYTTAPREIGVIGAYKRGTGTWGFIDYDSGDDSAFFHASSYYGFKPKEGTAVLSCAFPGLPRRRAHPVLPIREQEIDF